MTQEERLLYYSREHVLDGSPPSVINLKKDGSVESACKVGFDLMRLLQEELEMSDKATASLANKIINLMDGNYSNTFKMRARDMEMRKLKKDVNMEGRPTPPNDNKV